MTIQQWRQIGLFAALVLGVSLIDARLAWILAVAAGGVILIKNADKIVGSTSLRSANGGTH